MFAQKATILVFATFALSACVTNAGTNPYHAPGAGQFVVPSQGAETGKIHVISGGELHW